jgi:hypothetical protein
VSGEIISVRCYHGMARPKRARVYSSYGFYWLSKGLFMKRKSGFIQSAILMMAGLCANVSMASTLVAHQAQDFEHITIINNSDVTLVPTAAGMAGGCLGGSIPAVLDPVSPHTSRDITIIFLKYLPTCHFDVLPQPNIMTYLQGCHGVQASNKITFTGGDFLSLRCQISDA